VKAAAGPPSELSSTRREERFLLLEDAMGSATFWTGCFEVVVLLEDDFLCLNRWIGIPRIK
jgi:hypothetical protein